MARVSSIDSRVHELTGGLSHLVVEATSVRGLIGALEARFPGLGRHVEQQMAIAIDGEIHHDALAERLQTDSEVVLIPRIGGG